MTLAIESRRYEANTTSYCVGQLNVENLILKMLTHSLNLTLAEHKRKQLPRSF